jgi:CRP-like cAMP-binding protein
LNSETQFQTYILKYINISFASFNAIYNSLIELKVAKTESILHIGQQCKYQYFIVKGLLLASEIDDKGQEHIIQIGTENSWIGDLASFTNSTPSNRQIKAVEDCELLLLSRKGYETLLKTIPDFERLFRIIFQTAYIKQTERVSLMLNSDAENRFKIFKQNNEALLPRLEWKTIASYLNMSPETLSRIKNKLT